MCWAEGSKQKDTNPSTGIIFTNSDPNMLKLFLKWLSVLDISEDMLTIEIYVHENRKSEVLKFKRWWAEQLDISPNKITRVYFKRDKIKTNRKNIKDLYHGLLRITVSSSTVLNRRVNGWIAGIVQ